MSPTYLLASCTNSESVLRDNLLLSPDVQSGALSTRFISGARSASAAYSALLRERAADFIIFAHQDVYLPAGFKRRLAALIDDLSSKEIPWGVIGVYGASGPHDHAGYVYDGSNARILGSPVLEPTEVAVLDEVLLIVSTATGVDFDPALPGFHLYGTQIAIAAKALGLQALVVDLPIIHNSRSIRHLGRDYEDAWLHLAKTYGRHLPLPNLNCRTTTTSRWPLWWWRVRNAIKLRLGLRTLVQRHDDGRTIARQVGFEPI